MNYYNYKAKDASGRYQDGTIEAVDEKQAGALLRSHGLFVIRINPKVKLLSGDLSFMKGVSQSEVAHFTRYLATMLGTGLPLTDALSNLQSQSSPALAEVISSMTRDISGGSNLSDAMGRFPKVFNNLYFNLVRAGEASGTIDESLNRLADTLEKELDFKGKVTGAMVYPIIVVSAMGIIATIMMTVVIPKIAEVYKQFGADLPLPTQILITVSNFITNYTIVVIIVLAGVVIAYRSFKQTPAGDYFLSNLSFKIPVFGSLNKEVTLAVMTRTLGAMVGSGISILEALNIVADTVGNNIYREGLMIAAKDVEKGFPFSMSLKNDQNFPTIISQMVGIGEETGTMDKSLQRLAVFFEDSAERRVKTLTTALEPILILIMGVGVAGLAIAILMPMFNLVNVIK